MTPDEAAQILERLTPSHMPPGGVVLAIQTLINEAVDRRNEEREGTRAPDSPSAAAEYRRRPGKGVPTERWVLEQAQEALVEAGVAGYGPLSVHMGVQTLGKMLRRTQDQLATAQASTRQHLEASSHRAQIAEHYRAALQRVADDPNTDWQEYARAALKAVPEWDKRIRP